jgi:hypothetical protein
LSLGEKAENGKDGTEERKRKVGNGKISREGEFFG